MTVFRINHADANADVRRESLSGTEYVVAPAVAARAMELNGGYVPADEWVKSEMAWNGTPVTLTHPTDDEGRPMLANTPQMAEQVWLGRFFNADAVDDGDALEGDVWFNVDRAADLGDDATAAIGRVEDGESVDVSTAYFADRLDAGEYDGEHRDAVVGNLRPEHLAVLPNDEGRCSIEDGCGVPTPSAANAAVDDLADVPVGETVVVTDTNADAPTHADDADTPGGDGSSEAEDMGGGDGFDTDVEENAIRRAFNTLRSAVGMSAGDGQRDGGPIANDAGGDGSGAETQSNMTETEQYIDALVDNHGYDREVAEDMSDEALQTTHEQLTNDSGGDCGCGGADATNDGDGSGDADADGGGSDGGNGDDAPPEFNADEFVDKLADQFVTQGDLEDAFETFHEKRAERQKVDEIVDNSDEYDRETLADTPPEVVDNIHEDVMAESSAATFAARTGSPATNGDDELDKWETLVNRARGDEAAAESGD